MIVVDQALKHWVVTGLGLTAGESRPVLWPLSLTLVRNEGISFGFFQTQAAWTRWVLAGILLRGQRGPGRCGCGGRTSWSPASRRA